MKKNKFLLMGVALFVVGTAWAANQVFKNKGESSVEIRQQGQSLEILKTEVKYITDYVPDYSQQVLLKVTTNLKYNPDAEGREGTSVIEARSGKDFYATPIWTAADQGQEVVFVNNEMIRSVRYGCCGDFTRSILYNVVTGQSAATYLNDDFFTITVPNSQLNDRYMAQIDDPKAPADKNGKNYLGSIAYFDKTQKIAIVRFYVKLPSGWGAEITDVQLVNLDPNSKNTLGNKILELWDSDGNKDAKSAFKGFAMTAKIYFGNKQLDLQVPVNDDQIDEKGIKVSPEIDFDVVH